MAHFTNTVDYSFADNWLSMPSVLRHRADVFYMCPSGYIPATRSAPLLCGIDDAQMRANAHRAFERQATVFAPFADIYAPYYRQADAQRVLDMPLPELIDAIDGAPILDAAAALEYYFKYLNKGRPFFLAGHSQGSATLMAALYNIMPRRYERFRSMVAAYLIGFTITQKHVDDSGLKFAESADDTGVIISYNTERPGFTGTNVVVMNGALGINPINWRRDDTYAPASDNLGSLSFVHGEETGTLTVPGIADAKLDTVRGTVMCSTVDADRYYNEFTGKMFSSGSYHLHDYQFYYGNLRENGAHRLDVFLKSGAVPE